jgi:type VI secretion system protein ImpG
MEDLLRYYEEELAGFRREAAEFAKRYPKIASRLDLSANESTDPHVERLIESFALLCTRARLRAEAKWPAVAQSALQILLPDLLCPIPAMSIVRFELGPDQGKLETGFRVPRGSQLSSRPIAGEAYRFRTCFDVDLWPLTLTGVRLVPVLTGTALELTLRADQDISPDRLESLTIHLQGSSSFRMYDVLASRVERVEVWCDGKKTGGGPGDLGSVNATGLDDDQAALPVTRRTFAGFRLLREYLCMPEKFLFLKLVLPRGYRLDRLTQGKTISIRLCLADSAGILDRDLDKDAIQLGCTPIVNLFSQTAEPVLVNQKKTEYQVIPDVRRRGSREIYSIDEITTQPVGGDEPRRLLPLYGHDTAGGFQSGFWTMRRTAPSLDDDPIDAHISLVDLSLDGGPQAIDVLTVRTTCTNLNLPSRMPWGNESGDFEAENIPVSRIRMLRKPTLRLPPPLGNKTEWALISHMSLQHLSLSEDGALLLRRLLHALDVTDRRAVAVQIDSISKIETGRAIAHLAIGGVTIPVPGTRIEVQLTEDAFVGGGAYLFGTVLDRFLSLYASLNTFTQLRLTSPQRKGVVGNWPPRIGIQPVI